MCRSVPGRWAGWAACIFRATPPNNFEEATAQDLDAYRRFYHHMLDGGVYLPPSHVEAFFLSSAHSDADIDETVAAAQRAFQAVG